MLSGNDEVSHQQNNRHILKTGLQTVECIIPFFSLYRVGWEGGQHASTPTPLPNPPQSQSPLVTHPHMNEGSRIFYDI